MNEGVFFARCRALLFDGSLSAGQVAGIHAVLAACDRHHVADLRHRAYILASVYHETGQTMQPVREAFAKSDAGAVAALDKAFAAGRLGSVKTPYWRPDATGKSWFGRGLIQITHKANYTRMGTRLGVDLAGNPSVALDLAVSADIAVVGMTEGLFTGAALDDFFDDTNARWAEARRIVNGKDQASRIAEYGVKFHAALIAGRDAAPEPVQPPPVVLVSDASPGSYAAQGPPDGPQSRPWGTLALIVLGTLAVIAFVILAAIRSAP